MAGDDGARPGPAVERRTGRPVAPLKDEELTPEARDLAVHLRELYRRSNRRLVDLAAELDVHEATLSRYLSGRALPQRVSWVRKFQDLTARITGEPIDEDERDTGLELYYSAARKAGPRIAVRSELDQLRDLFAQRAAAAEAYIERLRGKLAAEREELADSRAEISRLKSRIGQAEDLARKLADTEARLAEEQRRNDEREARIARLEAELDEAVALATTLRENRDRFSALADAAAEGDVGADTASLLDSEAILPGFLDLGLARRPRVWGGVPLRDPGFTGRDGYLRRLRDGLVPARRGTTVPPLVLCGTNGVGKTHVVAEYLHRHAAEYDVVWWFAGEHPAQIRAGFVELARRLRLPVTGSAEAAVPSVLEALRLGDPHRRWVVVFDNVYGPATVSPFLPTGSGHVLITSCDPAWPDVADVIDVGPFTREESTRLIRRAAGWVDEAGADALAEALGDLPHAVSRVAAWLARTGMRVSEFLTLLAERPDVLDSIGADDLQPVARIWNVQLSRLRGNHPAAYELMRLLAFLGPGPISRDVLVEAGPAVVPDPLHEVLGDPVRLNTAIRQLGHSGLAKIDPTSGDVSVHRLLQAVVRNHTPTEEVDGLRRAARLMTAGRPGSGRATGASGRP